MLPLNSKAIILALITVLIWGSTFAAISVSLQGGYSAGHLILVRFMIASIIFLIIAFLPSIKFRLPAKTDLLRITFVSLVGISGYHLCVTFGQETVSAGTAGLIIGTSPIFTTLFAIWILKERLGTIGWIGLGFGFIGIILISIGSGDGLGFSPGIVLILMAAIATSLFFVYQKPLFEKYSAIELTAYFTWIGTIPFLYFVPGLFNDIQTASLEANLTAIFIGIFPTSIAYLTWSVALSLASASSISSILYIEPVIAIIVAWVWINDLPSILSILGGVITIAGVLIVNYFGKKQRLLQNPQVEPSTK